MIVNGFEWDQANEGHISKHNVLAEEVEEVFSESQLIRVARNERMYALGKTFYGRYLFVVFEKKGNGIIRVITSRDMNKNEKKLYKKWRR